MATKEEDAVEHLECVSTHDDALFFTNQGRLFRTKVYEIPASSRQAKGVALVNIIQLAPNEKVTAFLTTNKNNVDAQKYFLMATSKGVIKKTIVSAYNNVRKSGIIAIKLNKGDELKWVKITKGSDVVVEVSSKGQAICYPETDVRPMGRSAAGVRGINLRPGDQVMSVDVVEAELSPFGHTALKTGFPDMLVVLENGFGKRTKLVNFNLQKRGGVGIKAANCTSRTGNLVGMNIIYDDLGDVILVSRTGQVIRMKLNTIKRLGRDTQGVTLMKTGDDRVSSVTIIRPEEENDANDKKNAAPKNPVLPLKEIKPPVQTKKTTVKTKTANPKKPIAKISKPTNVTKAEPATAEDDDAEPEPEGVSEPGNEPADVDGSDNNLSGLPPEIKINAYKEIISKPEIEETMPLPEAPETASEFKVNAYKNQIETEGGQEEPPDMQDKPVDKPMTGKKTLFDEPNYWGKK
jgi:hypothetical protein